MIKRYSCLNFIDCRYPSAEKFTVKIKYVFPIRNQSCHNIAGKALFLFSLLYVNHKMLFYFYLQRSQQPQIKRIWNIFVIVILDSFFGKIVLLVDIKISLNQPFYITQINIFSIFPCNQKTFLVQNKETFSTTLFWEMCLGSIHEFISFVLVW